MASTNTTSLNTTNLDELRKRLEESWPSPLVARRDVEAFSGGILKRGTLANADSAGYGPTERYTFKEGVAYGKTALIDWMFSRRVMSPTGKKKSVA